MSIGKYLEPQYLAPFCAAFGTLVLAAVALWGDVLRAKIVKPKLSFKLRCAIGAIIEFDQGKKSLYHHAIVENSGKIAARNCHVLLEKIEKADRAGIFHNIEWLFPIQFVWSPNMHSQTNDSLHLKTVVDEMTFDLGFLDYTGSTPVYKPALYYYPRNFSGSVKPNEKVRYHIKVLAEDSKPHCAIFEVSWNGEISENKEEMQRHLTVTKAS